MKQQILNLIEERIAHLAAYQWTDGKWSERVGDCEVGMRELRLLKEQIEKLEESARRPLTVDPADNPDFFT